MPYSGDPGEICERCTAVTVLFGRIMDQDSCSGTGPMHIITSFFYQAAQASARAADQGNAPCSGLSSKP